MMRWVKTRLTMKSRMMPAYTATCAAMPILTFVGWKDHAIRQLLANILVKQKPLETVSAAYPRVQNVFATQTHRTAFRIR